MSAEEEAAELHWFAKWEEDFPSPEELMPLSQSLITPSLAAAFDIPTAAAAAAAAASQDGPNPASAAKKPRLVWTPQLHKRFVEAICRLGIKNAVPKTIMQLMNVEGLTRENVASHLQKYRLYLRRVQMQSAAAASSSPSSPSASAFIVDAASDRLFATAPVPRQFLAGPFAPYRPIAAAAAAAQQNQYHQQQRHVGLVMREHPQVFALKQPMQNPYAHYLAPGREDGRRALNLFPTGLD